MDNTKSNQLQRVACSNLEKTQWRLSECQTLSPVHLAVFMGLPAEMRMELDRKPEAEAKLWLLLFTEAARTRYEIPAHELLMMAESLKSYRLETVEEAFKRVRTNPAREFSGMPNADEIEKEVARIEQEQAAEAERRRGGEALREHEAYMRDVQEHPENYVRVDFAEMLAEAQANSKGKIPAFDMNAAIDPVSSPVLMGLDGGRRERELQQQKEMLEAKFSGEDRRRA